VRKHGGRQRNGWRFDFRHLHQKSGALSPFKRFAFELRDIIRRQPLPGYTLFARGRNRRPHAARFRALPPACGKPVDGLVLSGTQDYRAIGNRRLVLSGTQTALTVGNKSENRALNLESNKNLTLKSARAMWKTSSGRASRRRRNASPAKAS
jgi:plasmid replication initiation protein